MLARLSPQNAASTFGASIEQALQSVDVRVKRLEDQAGQGPLEEAVRSAEARLQRLERERDSHAQMLERVEALIASKVQDLRQNVNRSLEVIVDKVRGETENVRADVGARDTQLRKDFSLELDSMKDLRKLVDGFSHIETRFQGDLRTTRDVILATAQQLAALEDSVGHLHASVASLPGFLWALSLGEGPHRHPGSSSLSGQQQHPAGAFTNSLAASALFEGHGSAHGIKPHPPSATLRRQSPDSDSTELPSPRRFDGEHQPRSSRGGLARAALAEGFAHSSSADNRRRRKSGERRSNREALGMMSLAGEALMDAADPKWAEDRSAPKVGGSHSALGMAKLAGEALMDAADESQL